MPGTGIDPENFVNKTDVHSCPRGTYVLRKGQYVNKMHGVLDVATSDLEETKWVGCERRGVMRTASLRRYHLLGKMSCRRGEEAGGSGSAREGQEQRS